MGRGTYDGDKTPVQTFTEGRGKNKVLCQKEPIKNSEEYAKDDMHVNIHHSVPDGLEG